MGRSENDSQHTGSFAEGTEALPHGESPHDVGHFSEGQEQHHGGTVGHYSEGIERAHAEHERLGSFGDVDCPLCRERNQQSH